MPTEKPRFTITVSDELNSAIEDYQHRARTKNKTQAVVELMEIGMERISKEINNKKTPAPEGTEESIKRDRSYRLFDALVSAGLIRNDDLVADDINFLFHVLDVIEDWFARKERQ